MKKIITILLAVTMLLTLVACGGASETVAPGFCGTWKVDHALVEGAEFAASELEILDESIARMTIVIKDKGKAYISSNDSDGTLVDWSETETGILLDDVDLILENGLLLLEFDDEAILYFKKVSDSQLIENNTDTTPEETTTDEKEDTDTPDETTKPPSAEDGPSIDATPIDGEEHTAEDFKYIILTDGTIEIIKYIGTDSDVTISSSYDGYDVSRIGASAFEGCTTVEEIIMWPDVIVIGEAAFRGCTELEEFSIPSSVTVINDAVFENCTSLESIIIWGDVTSIGEAAFKNCSSLEEVSIPSSCVMIEKSAFEGCSDLEDVIFWGGEVIGERAFKDCTSLEEISIPSEVTAIGESAFEGCTSLESVIIWGDDITFGVNAFANCPKLDELPEGAYNDGTVDTDDSNGNNDNAVTTGIRPEFKKAMDEYEAFFDEYVEFMITFQESDDVAGMMGEYNSMMMQYVETMGALEDIDESELSDEEALYYAEVMLRINQKLLSAM